MVTTRLKSRLPLDFKLCVEANECRLSCLFQSKASISRDWKVKESSTLIDKALDLQKYLHNMSNTHREQWSKQTPGNFLQIKYLLSKYLRLKIYQISVSE